MSMTEEKQQAEPVEVEPEGGDRRGEARRLREEFFDDALVDRLLAATDERGVALTGVGGFLPEMIKAVLERGMGAELTDHLGYERGDPAGNGSGNSRNGTTPKTVATEVGQVELDQPVPGQPVWRRVQAAGEVGGVLDEAAVPLAVGGGDDRHGGQPAVARRAQPNRSAPSR